MTPEPPLGEEELAAINLVGPWEPTDLVPRLIAALRAKDEELQRMRAKVDQFRQEAIEDYARAEQAEATIVSLRSDVARLKAGSALP